MEDKSRSRDPLEILVDGLAGDLCDLALEIWRFAEVGLKEEKSAKAQISYLSRKGFSVTIGTGGMPTAFVAEWGKGRPIIGFLGEYDALAGLSQDAVAERRPLAEGAPGHGCGHNLLGVGALGAALALKTFMEERKMGGTVRYYGCPAEETLVGKVFMAREGVFDDLDAAITWHPGCINTVQLGSSNGLNSARFNFHGKTAHAAGDPHNGRSALDAVELMNIGANYLREHIIPDARIHYVVTDGGGQPNVVPARAQVWYYVRAPRRRQVEEIYARLLDVAKGAALMTGTTFDVEFLAGCYDVLPNETLTFLALDNFKKVGVPDWTTEELEFARRVSETIDKGQKSEMLRNMNAPKELYDQIMNTTVVDPLDKGKVMPGSTDVGDVSWIVPTVQVSVATWPIGTPGHSWQIVACSGHALGLRGMLVAAKVMAMTGKDLLENPSVLEKAKKEFSERVGDERYKSPLPDGLKPPLGQFNRH
ncbi:MAG TPA: amidohydrolase [Firmicutes bacterium]|nr:amidohydrolase [Candidatus Fermentithermobacillaceae bacterium]